jgi:hypothetical protein
MSDAQTKKRLKQGGGKAFHSRLEPFVEFIREQRQRRKTWQEIAELLRTEKSCPITFQGVYQFYRRFVKRQTRPHWERETLSPTLPTDPPRKTVLASLPPARPFKAPNPDSIQLNDPTNL